MFRLVPLLAEAGEFDRAEQLLANRFVPREEGAVNVRQIYLDVRLKQAQSLADHERCDQALQVVKHLGDADARFPFTSKGMGPLLSSDLTQKAINQIMATCHSQRAQQE